MVIYRTWFSVDSDCRYSHRNFKWGTFKYHKYVAFGTYKCLVGGLNPSEKYESQLGWLFPIYGKIKNGNQTTNQMWYNIILLKWSSNSSLATLRDLLGNFSSSDIAAFLCDAVCCDAVLYFPWFIFFKYISWIYKQKLYSKYVSYKFTKKKKWCECEKNPTGFECESVHCVLFMSGIRCTNNNKDQSWSTHTHTHTSTKTSEPSFMVKYDS